MGAELQHRRREIGAGAGFAELRVGQVTLVTIGKAEVLTGAAQAVELVGRYIVPQHVAAIVGEPQAPILGVPVETHRVAHPRATTSAPLPSGRMRWMLA
jgi:hypothetical protein